MLSRSFGSFRSVPRLPARQRTGGVPQRSVLFAITTVTDFGIMMGALLVAHWRENSASVPHTGERNQREKSGPKTAFH